MDIKAKSKELKASVNKPITKVQMRAYRYIQAYKPISVYDIKRLIEMVRLYELSVSHTLDGLNELDSLLGCCVELGSHRPSSTITRVRSKNDSDSYIKIDERAKAYRLEVKTNGGMVQDLYNLASRTKAVTYLHYYLDIDVRPSKKNPTGNRQIEFVCTLEHFLSVLEECKAISGNPAKDNIHLSAINIRPDNAKMFKRFMSDLENGIIIPFDRRMTYCKEDF